jgi:hypothetical protein
MGTVDPSGYVEREINKRGTQMYGQPSQMRSGLAQAALTRIGKGGGVNDFTNPAFGALAAMKSGTTPTGGGIMRTPTPVFNDGGGMRSPMPVDGGGRAPIPVGGSVGGPPITREFMGTGGSSFQDAALKAKLAAVEAQHVAEQAQQNQQFAQQQALKPAVSPTGKITPAKKAPNKTPSDLPFDYAGAQDQITAANDWGMLLNQLTQGRQGAQSEYSQGMHQLDMLQPIQERRMLNDYGSRGLAHGSGYGVDYGNLENEFAGQRSGIADALAQALAGYSNQEALGNSTYQQKLAAIQAAIAQKLAQQAGTLQLGR